jgi:hypothetical protein
MSVSGPNRLERRFDYPSSRASKKWLGSTHVPQPCENGQPQRQQEEPREHPVGVVGRAHASHEEERAAREHEGERGHVQRELDDGAHNRRAAGDVSNLQAVLSVGLM